MKTQLLRYLGAVILTGAAVAISWRICAATDMHAIQLMGKQLQTDAGFALAMTVGGLWLLLADIG